MSCISHCENLANRQEKIYVAAEATRTELEKFAAKNKHIGNPTTLMCFCAIGSYTLWNVYKKLDIKNTKFVAGEYVDHGNDYNHHCWNEVDDQIIDITATQFKHIYYRVFIPEPNYAKNIYLKDKFHYVNGAATRWINQDWVFVQTIAQNKLAIQQMVLNSVVAIKTALKT